MPDLEGKVALITGASGGIGESTAKHFASLRCWLSLTGRNTTNLDKVAEACCALGLPRDKVLVIPGDASVATDVAEVVQKTVKHFGRLDILVNNAGKSQMGSIESASLEDFKGVWEVNFCGALCMMKNAMPYLRQTKGNVVNVSSVAAVTPIPCAVPYAVTKAALEHLSRCAALENAPYGVRVNAVSPGVIRTFLGRPPGVSEEAFMTGSSKPGSETLTLLLSEASRRGLDAPKLRQSLESLGLDSARAAALADRWFPSCAARPQVRPWQLRDVEWRFGVTVASSSQEPRGSFVQLRLALANGQDVHVEMNLAQFYSLCHEMEQAKLTLEALR